MKAKSGKTLYRVVAVFLGIFVFLGALLLSVMIADVIVCKTSAHTIPHYPKEDISELADKKEEWTEEEIHFLYRQTGLGKPALLAMKSQQPFYKNGKYVSLSERLEEFQDALYYEGEMEHELVADISKRDLMKKFHAPVAPVLEPGDVFVNSSTHTLGFRNGHAALVVNSFGSVLESLELGVDSSVSPGGDAWFAESSNFILLRLKKEYADKTPPAKIAQDAVKELTGIPYDITVGLFSKKYQGRVPKATHCSHLVWQAFKNAGLDIDSNGGLIVTPRDIARSPYFEVVQVYGFDPEELW